METLPLETINEIVDYLDNDDCKHLILALACPLLKLSSECIEQRKRLHGSLQDIILNFKLKDDLRLLRVRGQLKSDPEKRQQLLNYLQGICPEDHQTLVDAMASAFDKAPNGKVYILSGTGAGNNEKTTFCRFMAETLGKLALSSGSSYFSSDSSRTSLSFLSEDSLFLFIEFDESERAINVGRLKSLTSGEQIYARKPFQEGKLIRLKARPFLVTNNHELLPARILQHMVLIRFSNVFGPYQTLDLSALKNEMMCYLIERYLDSRPQT